MSALTEHLQRQALYLYSGRDCCHRSSDNKQPRSLLHQPGAQMVLLGPAPLELIGSALELFLQSCWAEQVLPEALLTVFQVPHTVRSTPTPSTHPPDCPSVSSILLLHFIADSSTQTCCIFS